MKKMPRIQQVRSYLVECSYILYYAYFKPYTFSRWLRDAQLIPSDNPSTPSMKDTSFTIPRHRFESLIRLLSLIVPLLFLFLGAIVYFLMNRKMFNWLHISLFLLSWWIGLCVAALLYTKRWRWLIWLFLSACVIAYPFLWNAGWVSKILIFFVGQGMYHQILIPGRLVIPSVGGLIIGLSFGAATDLSYGLAIPLTIGVIGGIASAGVAGIEGGIVGGVMGGAAGGAAFTVSRGMAGGMSRGLIGGVIVGIVTALAVGVEQSLTSDMDYAQKLGLAVGVAFGIAFGIALGVSRGMRGRLVDTVIDVVVGISAGLIGAMAVGLLGGATYGSNFGNAFGIAGGIAWMIGTLRVLFWMPEFLIMFVLYLLSRKGNADRWLRYIPPRFDELIILPLPFIRELIIKAYHDNPFSARQTIDYLITSTNQQVAAAKAITNISIEVLRDCRTTSDISAIADQLAWIPNPSPRAMDLRLPQFKEISQSVRAALESSSFYRRYRELEKPINSLRQLQRSLAFGTKTWDAVTFGSITENWLSILETARKNLKEQADLSQEIPQEYIVGSALDPATAEGRFKGRLDLFREIENLATFPQPPVLLLYGGRRVGKTSALKYLPRHLGSDLVPLLVDMQGLATATTLPRVAETLAKLITDAARQSRNLRLPLPNSRSMNRDPFPDLLEWFEQIEDAIQGKQFLLCIDEFERLHEVITATGSRVPLNFLRHVIQHRPRWILLFSGSHHPSELDHYWSDYLINTRTLKVSYLEESEARELIVRPIVGFPDIYGNEAVEAILQLTRCQPYLVQLMCFILVEYLNRELRRGVRNSNEPIRKLTVQDVESSIPEVFMAGTEYFSEFWNLTLTSEERSLLSRLAKGDPLVQNEQKTLRKLEEKEVLERAEDGGYHFQVPLIQILIERRMLEEA